MIGAMKLLQFAFDIAIGATSSILFPVTVGVALYRPRGGRQRYHSVTITHEATSSFAVELPNGFDMQRETGQLTDEKHGDKATAHHSGLNVGRSVGGW